MTEQSTYAKVSVGRKDGRRRYRITSSTNN